MSFSALRELLYDPHTQRMRPQRLVGGTQTRSVGALAVFGGKQAKLERKRGSLDICRSDLSYK